MCVCIYIYSFILRIHIKLSCRGTWELSTGDSLHCLLFHSIALNAAIECFVHQSLQKSTCSFRIIIQLFSKSFWLIIRTFRNIASYLNLLQPWILQQVSEIILHVTRRFVCTRILLTQTAKSLLSRELCTNCSKKWSWNSNGSSVNSCSRDLYLHGFTLIYPICLTKESWEVRQKQKMKYVSF